MLRICSRHAFSRSYLANWWRRGVAAARPSCNAPDAKPQRETPAEQGAAALLRYDLSMAWLERIAIDPEVLAGKPVIRGTRLAVEFILGLLAAGQSEAEILDNYPGLTRDDILACLEYASCLAQEYKAHPVPA